MTSQKKYLEENHDNNNNNYTEQEGEKENEKDEEENKNKNENENEEKHEDYQANTDGEGFEVEHDSKIFNEKTQTQNNEKNILSKEDMDNLIDNKKSELDIRIFDLVTRNQVEEKKFEEIYENEKNEEKKKILLNELEELIKKNEDCINKMKE
jgi:hypothetical protein